MDVEKTYVGELQKSRDIGFRILALKEIVEQDAESKAVKIYEDIWNALKFYNHMNNKDAYDILKNNLSSIFKTEELVYRKTFDSLLVSDRDIVDFLFKFKVQSTIIYMTHGFELEFIDEPNRKVNFIWR